jgi:hypothetical protein
MLFDYLRYNSNLKGFAQQPQGSNGLLLLDMEASQPSPGYM